MWASFILVLCVKWANRHKGDFCGYRRWSDARAAVWSRCAIFALLIRWEDLCERPLLSVGIEPDETPLLVSINALTGLGGNHPVGLEGHVTAPLLHEPQRHFKLVARAQWVSFKKSSRIIKVVALIHESGWRSSRMSCSFSQRYITRLNPTLCIPAINPSSIYHTDALAFCRRLPRKAS